MAKQQSFVDKVSRRGKDADLISVKVVVASRTERGTYRFNERFIKVKDLAEVEQAVKG